METIDFLAEAVRIEPPRKVNPDGSISIYTVITVRDINIILDAISRERGGHSAICQWVEDNPE